MDISEIKSLIKESKFDQALGEIYNEMANKNLNLHSDEEYEKYKKLLSLRVTAKTLLDQQDDLINTIARKEKFPFQSVIDFGNDNIVRLLDKDIFFVKTGAYINTIYINKNFEKNDNSFSNSIVSKVGIDEISNQLNNKVNFGIKPFYIIEHKLSAKKSFHLPAVKEDSILDYDLLKNGLSQLLKYLIEIREKSFTFVALGTSAKIKNQEEHDRIIEIIADEIQIFFDTKPNSYKPEINFSFVNFKSLSNYDRVFKAKTALVKFVTEQIQQINDLQKEMLLVAKTKNKLLRKQLIDLSYTINEKKSIVLILGESGVGKSFLAKEIFHDLSNRRKEKFEHVNCAGFPSDLIYSILFGAEKGSYTGAVKVIKGVFEKADNGTVFLDEIGSVDDKTQLSLMTFFDTGKFTPLGSEVTKKANCKILLGTNQNLDIMVRRKVFRKEFYERIANDREITIPSLRDRLEDFDLIIDSALDELNKGSGKNINIGITEEARKKIKKFLWPGNYRQLAAKIRNWHEDTLAKNKIKIDIDIIENNLPRTSFFTESKIELLEKLLEEYIVNWDYKKKGKFISEFLNPILAKVYMENLNNRFIKSDSNKVLGFDGTRSDSTIDKLFEKYNAKVREKVI